ncbi:colanic acid biosynthesis acetyltransferase WcaF [Pedobacter deserti]|uniref:colanic acid biosynthesis acetyltransferase WcaF n=1 Tax=Pedobacter deserti TaxID=2817382 RepID=UPI00210E0F26|nr:colanic acid biosynthesis acetyltransferase WcaF [Pedobacter sp. SYSU D00382]
MQLKKNFDKKGFSTGASLLRISLWYFTSTLLVRSGIIPSSSILVFILKLFGARIGKDVRIKPGIQIKYPWKLRVGDHCWLAECTVENTDFVLIGNNVCISQQAMIITGNHDYTSASFDLLTRPVIIEDSVWIAARAILPPGTWAHKGSVLTIGSVAAGNLTENMIYKGNPAAIIRQRKIQK